MNAIEILVKEHDSILDMIEITERILQNEDPSGVNFGHVEQIVDFIRNFADKYHHLKEEDILFAEMEKHGMPRLAGPIAVMLHEHDEGRNYIRLALEGIESYQSGNRSGYNLIKDNLLNYCSLLKNHISKENNILYPIAERILPGQVLLRMTNEFETANSSTIENEYHDKYLKMAEELRAIYIK